MVLCTIKYILSDQQFLINKSPFTCYIGQSFQKMFNMNFQIGLEVNYDHI